MIDIWHGTCYNSIKGFIIFYIIIYEKRSLK